MGRAKRKVYKKGGVAGFLGRNHSLSTYFTTFKKKCVIWKLLMGALIGTMESALIAVLKPRQECSLKWFFDKTALINIKGKILRQDLVENVF